MNTYISDRSFKIWTYSIGHSQLILRSEIKSPDIDSNIDIHFTGIDYIDLPHKIEGVSICEIKEDIPFKFSKYIKYRTDRLFEITSREGIFYIVASFYIVAINKWGEDKLSNPSLQYDNIIFRYPIVSNPWGI